MKIHFIVVFLFSVIFFDLHAEESGIYDIITFNELEPRLNISNDSLYIVNFWATWCIPCRKELPEFETVRKEFGSKPVKILLVSLDFPNQQEQVKKFINKNQINAEVIILNSPDANKWIDKVDKNWSGALPATLIFNKTEKKFYEGEIDYATLKNQIINMLNH